MNLPPRFLEKQRPLRRGFTLIELLVTIGIIVTLASLILPSISKMRRGADAAQCQSNLRQVYLLWQRDVQDNNFEIPPAFNSLGYPVAGIPTNAGWLDFTWNQLTNTGKTSSITEKVFGCPSQRKLRKKAANARTYSMNSLIANTYWNGANRLPPIIYHKFAYPSKSLLFSDGAYDGTPYNSAVNGGNKMPEAVHDGSANLVFMDGHVERRKLADIPLAPTSLESASTLDTPASIFWLGR
jgi:prepilin-type N-terminal cleavage/methylation domain-containing protein/prepilin-type processing-associated H-X9-DG protein